MPGQQVAIHSTSLSTFVQAFGFFEGGAEVFPKLFAFLNAQMFVFANPPP